MLKKIRLFAAIAAMLMLGACAAGPKLSTVDDPVTGVHYVSFTGGVDHAGGPRVSAVQAWQPVPGPYGEREYVLRSDDAGSGYGTGQTLANTATAGAFSAIGAIGGGWALGAATRPSNISVSQGGAVAVSRSRGGNAISNSSSSASSSSSSAAAAAACGNAYGC